MPSEYQTGTGSTDDYKQIAADTDVGPDVVEHFAEAVKMLSTKNPATIRGLVKGIRHPDRARAYVKAELAVADAEDREPRRKLIGMCNRMVTELTEDD